MLARIRYLLAAVALSASASIIGVTGMGSFPVSQNTLAFWLLQADNTPLVMVYYHGPAQWHDAEWKIDSQFTNSAVGWGELKCAKATLHIRVHTTDAQQKIIPLGHHRLLKTAENPAAVMLLDSDKALKERIQNEAGSI